MLVQYLQYGIKTKLYKCVVTLLKYANFWTTCLNIVKKNNICSFIQENKMKPRTKMYCEFYLFIYSLYFLFIYSIYVLYVTKCIQQSEVRTYDYKIHSLSWDTSESNTLSGFELSLIRTSSFHHYWLSETFKRCCYIVCILSCVCTKKFFECYQLSSKAFIFSKHILPKNMINKHH